MSSTSTAVQTIVQKFYPRTENAPAVIHLPMDVSFTSFTQDGRPAQIIDTSSRNQVILDATNRNQVILDAANRNPTAMIQAVNRNQVMIAEPVNRNQVMIAEAANRNPTLNLQKINYTIQDLHGNQHASGSQNYQVFQAETYHPNVLGQNTDHPIYHIDKGGGELISLRPIRLSGDVNMQLPTGY